ncbi:hypothetical protein C8255_06135 [filamentous cyanobacterium CCP3]|nr:hypothetical protein C8255_06135 [filamentous cyanobacterium CCP3]
MFRSLVMPRYSASLIQQLIEYLSQHLMAMVGVTLAGLAAAQPAHATERFTSSVYLGNRAVSDSNLLGSRATSSTVSATVSSPVGSVGSRFSNTQGAGVRLAQAITPADDGTGSVVTQTGTTFDITGGTPAGGNLFHSFEQLGLDAGQAANFIADPAIANILGRVVGGDPSIINGLLQVTGGNANLFLMNPAGIVFGPNAQVIVPGAFTATTAEAIQLGDYWFNALGANDYANLVALPSGFAFASSEPGALINAGNLSGESVTLLGGLVVNTGTIAAPGGNITVAAVPGENLVRITQEGSLLSLDLPIEVRDGLNSVGQTLTTVEIPDLLVGGSTPQGLGLVVEDGVVKLASTNTTLPTEAGTTIASGRLDVSDTTPGSTGGIIDVLGNRVALLDATLQASGSAGGGTVRVGGDYRGQGTVPNAEQTYVGEGSTIAADALAAGDGGRIIVWADDSTQFYGAISARGGAASGDGGFAEVSGRETLVFDGTADVSAANGVIGTLLLDPKTIIISNESSTPPTESELPNIFSTSFPGNDITINATALTQQTGNIILQATEDIIIRDVSLNFAEVSSRCGSIACLISFVADADSNGSGNFQMNTSQSIIAPGRSILISGASIEGGNINVTRVELFPYTSVELTATTGGIFVGDIQASDSVRMSAERNIVSGFITNFGQEISGEESRPNSGVFLSTSSGNIRVVGIDTFPGFLDVRAGGLFQVTGVSNNSTLINAISDRTPPSRLARLDINAVENREIRNFLISNGYLRLTQDGQDVEVNTLGSENLTIDEQFIFRSELEELLLIRENGRTFIREGVGEIATSVALRGEQENTFAQIVANGKPVLIIENGIPNFLASPSEFVIGPQIGNLQASDLQLTYVVDPGNSTSNLEPPSVAVIYKDYATPLTFGSASFPATVSGFVGTILIGYLEGNSVVGIVLSPVEYEPPQVVQSPVEGATVNLALSNRSELSSEDILEDESNSENSNCEAFESTDVLSVSEVAPEECQSQIPANPPTALEGPSIQSYNQSGGTLPKSLVLPSEASTGTWNEIENKEN